jgi:hypothetical protein
VGDDVPAEVRESVIAQRRASDTADGVRETYRRIEIDDALRMLHARSAIAQVTVSRLGG